MGSNSEPDETCLDDLLHGDTPMSLEETIEASEKNYEWLQEWNSRHDAKTATLVTLATALLGLAGALVSSLNSATRALPSIWVAVACMTLPLCGVIMELARATQPHLGSDYTKRRQLRTESADLDGPCTARDRSSSAPPKAASYRHVLPKQPKYSMIYFGTLALLTLEDFHDNLLSRTKQEYIADLAAQQHVTAQILALKFRFLARAYKWLWLALFAFVPACFTFSLVQDSDLASDPIMRTKSALYLWCYHWYLGAAGKSNFATASATSTSE